LNEIEERFVKIFCHFVLAASEQRFIHGLDTSDIVARDVKSGTRSGILRSTARSLEIRFPFFQDQLASMIEHFLILCSKLSSFHSILPTAPVLVRWLFVSVVVLSIGILLAEVVKLTVSSVLSSCPFIAEAQATR